MFSRPFLTVPVRFSSLLWVIVAGTLFVVCMTLRHISVRIEDYATGVKDWRSYWMESSVRNSSYQQLSQASAFSNHSFRVFSKTYVISLPRRADRRAQMDFLKDALHVDWTYKDAIEANSSAVATILRQVYILRSQLKSRHDESRHMQDDGIFHWPPDIEAATHSQGPLPPFGADFWTLPSSHGSTDLETRVSMEDPHAFAYATSTQPLDAVDPPSLACTSGNDVSATFSSNLPLY